MNLFEAAKTISALDAAKRYAGITTKVQKGTAYAVCPFCKGGCREIAFPLSGKNKGRFLCHKCGAHGSSVDFTAKMFNLESKDAAKKVCMDFGVEWDGKGSAPVRPIRSEEEAEKRRFVIAVCKGFIAYCKNSLEQLPDDEYRELDRSALTEMEADASAFLEAVCKDGDAGREKLASESAREKLEIISRFLTNEDRKKGTNYLYWYNKGII